MILIYGLFHSRPWNLGNLVNLRMRKYDNNAICIQQKKTYNEKKRTTNRNICQISQCIVTHQWLRNAENLIQKKP